LLLLLLKIFSYPEIYFSSTEVFAILIGYYKYVQLNNNHVIALTFNMCFHLNNHGQALTDDESLLRYYLVEPLLHLRLPHPVPQATNIFSAGCAFPVFGETKGGEFFFGTVRVCRLCLIIHLRCLMD
jgi:hypothetical protein